MEDSTGARWWLAALLGATVLAAGFWSGFLESDGLLSARLSDEAPRYIATLAAAVLALRAPRGLRIALRPRPLLEIAGGRIIVQGEPVTDRVTARRRVNRRDPDRGRYGPLELVVGSKRLVRLESTRPHRAEEIVELIEAVQGPSR